MAFTPLVGTLGYILDRSTASVLMIHRNARPDDQHLGKYNGLGGKVEVDEDIVGSLRRELHEEANLTLTSLALRGTITWSGFGPNGEDWLGFVFLIDGFDGVVPRANEEGTLSWVPLERLLRACADDETARDAAELPMWEGDRHFIPLVFDDDPRSFHGTMPYSGGRPHSWAFERL